MSEEEELRGLKKALDKFVALENLIPDIEKGIIGEIESQQQDVDRGFLPKVDVSFREKEKLIDDTRKLVDWAEEEVKRLKEVIRKEGLVKGRMEVLEHIEEMRKKLAKRRELIEK